MAFFQTYAASEGLDRFPQDKRFCAWRSAHKSLVKSDEEYRRFRNIHLGITALYFFACGGNGVFFASNIAIILLGVLCTLVATLIYVAWCFILQGYVNRRVAQALRASGDRA